MRVKRVMRVNGFPMRFLRLCEACGKRVEACKVTAQGAICNAKTNYRKYFRFSLDFIEHLCYNQIIFKHMYVMTYNLSLITYHLPLPCTSPLT